MRSLTRLLPYLRPHKWRIALAAFCVLLSGAFVMISPLIIGWAIDYGLDPVRVENAAGKVEVVGVDGTKTFLILAGLALVVFALARGITAFGQQYVGEMLAQRVAFDIRNSIYENLQKLSFAYHDKVETGQVMSRATQDVENIRMFANMGVLRLIQVVLILVITVIGMFVINWQLALISSITLPILAWRSIVVSRRMRPLWTDIQQSQAEMTQTAEEGLSGIRVVKAFAREDYEAAKFMKRAEEQANLNYTQARIQATHTPLLMGLSLGQVALTTGVGALFIANGSLTEGQLITFVLWLNLVQMPIRMLGFIVNMFARAISATDRVFELIDAQSAVQDKPDAIPLTNPRGEVKFDHVSFAYEGASSVLKDVNIEAEPGKVIALLGPTGSGKTTLVNLLPRFYDVTEGAITVDGIDVRDLQAESLRENIGIVQQDVFLFVGTIHDNIAYGLPDATQEDIEKAATAARIHDFIVSLPHGYNEWVGERGVTLSGGQKQRIAIARTLLRDPAILILDDSTASVDTQTEFLIQQALNELMKGRTTFVIAQRLRTVMEADEIIVLDRGVVVERGKHEDLVGAGGLYNRIYELELRDQVEALERDLAAIESGRRRTESAAGALASGGGN